MYYTTHIKRSGYDSGHTGCHYSQITHPRTSVTLHNSPPYLKARCMQDLVRSPPHTWTTLLLYIQLIVSTFEPLIHQPCWPGRLRVKQATTSAERVNSFSNSSSLSDVIEHWSITSTCGFRSDVIKCTLMKFSGPSVDGKRGSRYETHSLVEHISHRIKCLSLLISCWTHETVRVHRSNMTLVDTCTGRWQDNSE